MKRWWPVCLVGGVIWAVINRNLNPLGWGGDPYADGGRYVGSFLVGCVLSAPLVFLLAAIVDAISKRRIK